MTLRSGSRLPDLRHGVADLDCVFQLRSGEGLGGVLEVHIGLVGDLLCVFRAQLRPVNRDLLDPVPVEAEDHPTLQGGGRVVQVHDGLLGPSDRIEGALDEVFAGLGQDLDDDIIGDEVLLDEHAHEIEVSLRCRGEADLDLLVPHSTSSSNMRFLRPGGHGIDEGLVAVAQVDRAPAGAEVMCDRARCGQADRRGRRAGSDARASGKVAV